jgi:hypothetical protein
LRACGTTTTFDMDADQPPAAGVLHDLGRDVLLLAGLAALHTGDHLERQVGQAGVDNGPASDLSRGLA